MDGLKLLGYGWEHIRKVRMFQRDYYRIHYVLNGEGIFQLNTNEYRITSQHGFIIFPGETPNFQTDDDNLWEYFWIAITGDAMKKLIKPTQLSRKFPLFHCEGNHDKMLTLLQQFQVLAFYHESSLESCMQSLFAIIKPYEQNHQDGSSLFDLSIRYIHNHYNQQININDIAKTNNIDRSYLYKLFMHNIHISPQEYLLKYRIEKACELLRFTKLPLTDIAYSVGFQDYSGFSKQFKKYSQVSPRSYRKLSDSEQIF